jgi:hypothetical protein
MVIYVWPVCIYMIDSLSEWGLGGILSVCLI